MLEIERQRKGSGSIVAVVQKGEGRNTSKKTCPNTIFPPQISQRYDPVPNPCLGVNIQVGWIAYFRAFCFAYSTENANYTTKQLINSMEQIPSWKAIISLARPEIPRILRNMKFHYRVCNSQPHVPTLSQIKPNHAPHSYFLKIYMNIIPPSTSRSSKWSLSLGCLTKSVCTFLEPIHATCAAPLFLQSYNWKL